MALDRGEQGQLVGIADAVILFLYGVIPALQRINLERGLCFLWRISIVLSICLIFSQKNE